MKYWNPEIIRILMGNVLPTGQTRPTKPEVKSADPADLATCPTPAETERTPRHEGQMSTGPSFLPSERPAIRPSFRITRDGRAKAPAEPLAARCEQERRAGFSGKPRLNSEAVGPILSRRLRRSVRPTIAGLHKSRADAASPMGPASDTSRQLLECGSPLPLSAIHPIIRSESGLGPSFLLSEQPAIRPSFRITRDGRAKAPAEPLAARCEQERRAGFSGKPRLNSEAVGPILSRRLRRSVRPTIAGLYISRADMGSPIGPAADASRQLHRVRQPSAAFRDLPIIRSESGLGPGFLPSERAAIRPSFRFTRDGRAKAPAEPLRYGMPVGVGSSH